VLPLVLLDCFPLEPLLSVVVGEFLNATRPQRHIAVVLFRVRFCSSSASEGGRDVYSMLVGHGQLYSSYRGAGASAAEREPKGPPSGRQVDPDDAQPVPAKGNRLGRVVTGLPLCRGKPRPLEPHVVSILRQVAAQPTAHVSLTAIAWSMVAQFRQPLLLAHATESAMAAVADADKLLLLIPAMQFFEHEVRPQCTLSVDRGAVA